MRMREPFEAYLDDYNRVNVYISKTFYEGSSKGFYMKDTKNRILPLKIVSRADLYNGYTHYNLHVDGTLRIGEEYTVYEEHCKTTICQYGHICKTDTFCKEYEYKGHDLGLTYTPKKSTFKLWSPVAHEILLAYTHDGVYHTKVMKRRPKGIFEIQIEDDLLGDHYTFMVRVNGLWQEIVDPYTSFTGPNATYSVVMDISLLDLPKKVKLPTMKSNCDAIIYEASVRDMTAQAGIGVVHAKKFKGFTEENETTKEKETGFTYLKSLGVTHVQLLPVFDFGTVDEIYPEHFYNWGYDPVQYRALEGSYAVDPSVASDRIVEFANLVQNCHKAGIRVNLDLVFNHVYDKGAFALEKLMPNYYFLMNTQGEFSNGSFCGNDIDTQPPMARQYFIDTCKRIVQWFDVDGFRFDLMGILDIGLMNEIVKVCRAIKPDFMVYGEGWNMPSFVSEDLRASQKNQAKMPEVGHFSDAFRECIRGNNSTLNHKGFISGDTSVIYATMDRMSASGALFDSPEKVINYVECHDNHTLWDKNRVCCHGEGRGLRQKRQVIAGAMVLLAQGVPFIHAGQEFARSKQNVGNSYNSPDNINMIDYKRKDENHHVVDQYKELIKIRKEHPCFRLDTIEKIRDQVQFETIQDQVLVYRCHDEKEQCVSFFNPTYETFHYSMNKEGTLLFDSDGPSGVSVKEITIAPHGVVVWQAER